MTLNMEDLPGRLDDLGVPAIYYSIGGLDGPERYTIKHEGAIWEVYYFERGNKNVLKQFHNEHDACAYFLEFIQSDTGIMSEIALGRPDAPPS